MAMNYEVAEEGHLGGFTIGGDPATWYPELWTWLVEDFKIKSVLDIGCGEGHSTKFFAYELGIEKSKIVGIDGVPQDSELIIQHDFTKGPWKSKRKFDLVWCCEFVEHIEEQYIHNVVPAFQMGRFILMTHAFPGQGGYHHVNCRDREYWKGFMAAAGLRFDPDLTVKTRELSISNDTPWNHYLRSGMAFINP